MHELGDDISTISKKTPYKTKYCTMFFALLMTHVNEALSEKSF